ncbi:MAG: phospho-sugar mutase, partial [Oscillospiraceae bacterium]
MYKDDYKRWLEKATDDKDLIPELLSITGNDDAIRDRFMLELEFGTAGLRGVIGAGSYRMNIYTVRKATQGMADYIKATKKDGKVAISYDSRHKSLEFSMAAAEVLAANGIHVYIYKELMPTPALSFAVRELKCDTGIMMTASHNPAKYNGYKAYGSDGCQMTNEAADAIYARIQATDVFDDVKTMDFETALAQGKIEYIKDEVYDAFYANVEKQSVRKGICQGTKMKLVYTPLNGTGNIPVRKVLSDLGITDITLVKEQELPDGDFPTCPYPNPEIYEALAKGLALAKE